MPWMIWCCCAAASFGDAQRLFVHFNFTFAANAEFIVGLDRNRRHERDGGEHEQTRQE